MIAIIFAIIIILIATKRGALTFIETMMTRANRELLSIGSGGAEAPWVAKSATDLSPCDPSNNLRGVSDAWFEVGRQLKIKTGASSDDLWTVSGSDISPNAI